MASEAPDRTLQQRMEALARGNDIRLKRSRLKRELKEGRRSPAVIIFDPPDFTENMKVYDLLLAVPKYGQVKTTKLLTHHRISSSKTVGGMSQRQRRELISAMQNPS